MPDPTPQDIAAMSAAIDTAIAPDSAPTPIPGVEHVEGGPPIGQDPSDAAPDQKPEGAPSSTTPDSEVPPDNAPQTPEDEKPKDPAVTDPADPPAPGEKPPARPSDEFEPLPESTPVKTKERFEQLRTKYDEVVGEREAAVEQAQTWHRTIAETGATPEQFGTTLNVLRDINAGTPEALGRALDALLGQAAEISKVLGRELPGRVDPLDDHPDLKARLDPDHERPITREDALELAQARARGKMDTQRQEVQTTQQAQEQEYNTALQNVTTLGASLRATNPAEFAAKLGALTPLITQITQTLPPARWDSAIREVYAAIPYTPAPLPRVHVPNGPDPLRQSGVGAGPAGLEKQPGSAMEAMEAALAAR